jgi:transcriptional regulator with GAF, ATPase, and Fis domain
MDYSVGSSRALIYRGIALEISRKTNYSAEYRKVNFMSFDINDFFRQATMRICGDLNIESALWRCLEYLETVLPVTGMVLLLFDHGFDTVQTIAQVTRYKEHIKLRKINKLVQEAKAGLLNTWMDMKVQKVAIFNRPELDAVARTMTQLVKKPNTSIMVLRLKIEDNRLGALVLYVDQKDQYAEEHAQMLSLLHDPFAIAMSNALKHEDVLNLKNMLADDIQYLNKELLRITGDEIIGENRGLQGVMEMVRQIAPLNSPALLLGETGVGKEVIANAIHYSSPRRHGPFIKVNCGAIPESLIDSELFGHEKGAFTGATAQKRGRFERAHNGTIFLDEIGDLPFKAQTRLLRVLQSKEIERVGGTESIPVDVRIISATHRNLEEMIALDHFREDLWFRLNVFPIIIPPLRQRKEDIPALVRHFLERKSGELNIHKIPDLAPGAISSLKSHHWPGNVRELENVVERALIQNRGTKVSSLLSFELSTLPQKGRSSRIQSDQESQFLKLDDAMANHIRQALKIRKGKIDGPNGAAEILGINPSTLRSRMKKLGVSR